MDPPTIFFKCTFKVTVTNSVVNVGSFNTETDNGEVAEDTNNYSSNATVSVVAQGDSAHLTNSQTYSPMQAEEPES